MECRAYGICLDSQSRGYLGKDRKVSSAAGGNLSRMHKTEETAKESRLNFMYSHLRNRTLANNQAANPIPDPSLLPLLSSVQTLFRSFCDFSSDRSRSAQRAKPAAVHAHRRIY